MTPIRWILAVAALCLLAVPADADEVYHWVDENGQHHFSATPPPKGSARTWDDADEKRDRIQVLPEEKPEARNAAPAQRQWRGSGIDEQRSRAAGDQPRNAGQDRAACERYQSLRRQAREKEQQIDQLRSRIERMESSNVTHESKRCGNSYVDSAGYRHHRPCSNASYVREDAIEEARREIDQLQSEAAKIDSQARYIDVPPSCGR